MDVHFCMTGRLTGGIARIFSTALQPRPSANRTRDNYKPPIPPSDPEMRLKPEACEECRRNTETAAQGCPRNFFLRNFALMHSFLHR